MSKHPAHDKLIAIAKGWKMEFALQHTVGYVWEACDNDFALAAINRGDSHRVRIAPGQPEVAETEPRHGQVTGRLATCRYKLGDPLPQVGSDCLVSGANCDVESDQHRSYMWRRVIGYSVGNEFVCLQTRDCWPTVERLSNCWFAEIAAPTHTAAAGKESGND